VHRAIVEAQREHFHPPDLARGACAAVGAQGRRHLITELSLSCQWPASSAGNA
jgi:hypothetical protein